MEQQRQDIEDQELFEGSASRDPLVQYLVDMANSAESIHLGVTLKVDGSLISGILVSGAHYFQHIAAAVAGPIEKASPEAGQQFRAGLENFGSPYRGLPKSEGSIGSQRYFHMRDAYVFLGGHEPVLGPVWCRGRIDRVSAVVSGVMREPPGAPGQQDA